MYEKLLRDKKYGSTLRFVELTNENELQYVDQIATLLNDEWPRSHYQRVSSLKSILNQSASTSAKDSKTRIPVCLLLIDSSIKDDERVIGHASIVSISSIVDNQIENLPFLQSVIIDKSYRGQGLGKQLMFFCEAYLTDFAKHHQQESSKTTAVRSSIINCSHLYLNTKDKQSFYEQLGYVAIEPIVFFTNKEGKCSDIMKNLFKNQLQSMANVKQTIEKEKSNQSFGQVNQKQPLSVMTLTGDVKHPPPPPAPPPPPQINIQNQEKSAKKNNSKIVDELFWYKKRLIF